MGTYPFSYASLPVPTAANQYPVSNSSDQWVLTQVGTIGGNSYNAGWTVSASDLGGEALYSSSSPGTATIPLGLTAVVGESLAFRQTGTGVLTVAGAASVTIVGPATTTGQYQTLFARQIALNTWAVTASADVVAEPAGYWGYLGWTADPADWANAMRPQGGQLCLTRFRAAVSGTIGHIIYSLVAQGGTLTSGQNWAGIYDTGQTLAGSATLIGSTADQTTNFGSGALGPISAAITSGTPLIVAGEDYFFAVLSNGTTRPQLSAPLGSATTVPVMNTGLSGLGLRTANGNTTYTTLPAAVTAANLAGASTANLAPIAALLTA